MRESREGFSPSVAPSQTPYTIGVAAPGGSANKSGFTVKADLGLPTITGFTPTLASSGTPLTINGTNFDPVAGNDRLTLNATFAQVTSPTTTSIQTTIPPSAFTGHVAVGTPNGTATSTNYLWIPPPPYTVASVASMNTLSFGSSQPASVSAADKIALFAFDGVEKHRAAINVASKPVGIAPSICTVHLERSRISFMEFSPTGSSTPLRCRRPLRTRSSSIP